MQRYLMSRPYAASKQGGSGFKNRRLRSVGNIYAYSMWSFSGTITTTLSLTFLFVCGERESCPLTRYLGRATRTTLNVVMDRLSLCPYPRYLQ
ncbi:hypothetical protein BJX63DRAFT_109793 [Aspergillus granulosus]|uniref:Uncharacterized protein n=1 Tax=Aspergillus granulosus TaxID=176169 RepID=A0ABR4HPQ1_9EURO